MITRIEKQGKGYNLFINGSWIGWVLGSKRTAEKELKIEISRAKENQS